MATMAVRRSAGILLFRRSGGELELLLVHPGGPFWARKDDGAWSIPKGEYEDAEDARAAALREFAEEIGSPLVPQEPLVELGTLRQPGGKFVTAWAAEGELDPATVASNTFELEWPPRSGKLQQFPEVDRAEWFAVPQAQVKILRGQAAFIDALVKALADAPD
jgi:predicted NUDIX family NTP pyrophosphohydrolase